MRAPGAVKVTVIVTIRTLDNTVSGQSSGKARDIIVFPCTCYRMIGRIRSSELKPDISLVELPRGMRRCLVRAIPMTAKTKFVLSGDAWWRCNSTTIDIDPTYRSQRTCRVTRGGIGRMRIVAVRALDMSG